jgi:hypothetical protein
MSGYPSVLQDIETVKTAIQEARAGKTIILTDALATAITRVIKDAGQALSTAYELAGISPPGEFSSWQGQLKKALVSIDRP